jgi:hypothetical protein
MKMENKFNLVAARQSAALFTNTSHLRFAKRRCAGLATLALGFLILHSCFCLRILGQQYSIDWYKVAGGGGTSTGGMYQVSGTIGQHDAGGPMVGGNYSLTGGFWSLISVVQSPGAPMLYISHSGNTVTVYWQVVSGWNLQQNNNLTVPAGWSGSSGVTTSNGTNYLNVTPPTGNLFFRLANP